MEASSKFSLTGGRKFFLRDYWISMSNACGRYCANKRDLQASRQARRGNDTSGKTSERAIRSKEASAKLRSLLRQKYLNVPITNQMSSRARARRVAATEATTKTQASTITAPPADRQFCLATTAREVGRLRAKISSQRAKRQFTAGTTTTKIAQNLKSLLRNPFHYQLSLAILVFVSLLSACQLNNVVIAQAYEPSTSAAAAAAAGPSVVDGLASSPTSTSSQQQQQAESQQAQASSTAGAAACFGGLQTFEKISMSTFENPTSSSSSPGGGGNSGTSFGSGILVQQDDQALTSECINLCRSQPNCLSFVIDYNKFECKSYATTQQELQQEFAMKFQSARSTNSSTSASGDAAIDSPGGYQAAASSSQANFQQLLPSASSNYFEKICLDGVANRNQFADVCGQGRLWTVERVVDSFLDGFVEKEVTNVNGKDECSKLCIFETQFVCRSADYDQQARLCRLSKEDRRTQPQAMRYVANSNRQYLESQCATPGPSSCVYETKRNVGIISMDALKFAQTAQDCQMKCNQETTFNCRSYSFHQQRCFLSGDDSVSLNSNLIKLPQKQGWTFGEKRCLVELCTKGLFSYEKITGFTLRSALSTSIDLMVAASSAQMGAMSSPARAAINQQSLMDNLHLQESNVIKMRLMQSSPTSYNSSSLASAMMMLMSGGGGDHQNLGGKSSFGDPMHESASSTRQTRSASNLAITGHCRHSCDLGYLNCPAFTIDYKNNRCQRLDRNSQGRHHELVARDGFAYYEKICLRVPEIMSMCQDKFWIFERVIGYELAPRLYERSLKFVQSRRDCEEYCLEERQFQCRSALYNDETSDCKLSRYNRRLALLEGAYYRNFNARLSYLENNCLRDHQFEKKEQCYYEQAREEPAYPTFTERIEMAAPPLPSSNEQSMNNYQDANHSNNNNTRFGSGFCEQLCNENAKFECHSFGYYASTAQCFLSGDDSISAGELASTPSTGFTYYEKKCRLTNSTGGGTNVVTPSITPDAENDSRTTGIGTIISSTPTTNSALNPYLPQPPAHNQQHHNEAGAPHSTTPAMSDLSGQSPATTSSDNQMQPPAMSHNSSNFNTYAHAHDSQQPNSNSLRPYGGGGGSSSRNPASTSNTSQTQIQSSLEPDLYKCGAGHTYVYQRISGFEPIGGYLTLLVKNNEQPGIVAECADLCKRAFECRAFVVDYNNNQCFAMLENSSVGLLSLRQTLGKDYFEGFCLANHLLLSGSNCRNKTWLVDKIVDQAVVGVQHSRLIQDSDRFHCRQACFEERLFYCKSAMFDSATSECKLYSIDRESMPQMRLLFTKGADFFENQCQISSSACPYDAIERDMTIVTATKSLQARSTFDCELACNTETSFNCRSYTYLDQYPSLPNLCLLSSDSRSTSQRGSVARHQRTLYAERNCYYRKPRYPGGSSSSSSSSANSQTMSNKFEPSYATSLQAAQPSPALNSLQDPYKSSPPDFMEPLAPHSQVEDKFAPSPTPPRELEGSSGPSLANPYEPAGGIGPPLGLGAAGCEPHQFTFERTFGYDLKLAAKERAPIAPTIGISIGCQQECLKRGERCQSFVVEYALPYQSCFLLESQAGANKRLLVKSPNSAYFEKVCLPRSGLSQSETTTSSLDPTISHNPMSMPQQVDTQSLDISPSYSQEPWSPQAPPANANQLPYYLQQQQLVQNYPSRACSKLWSFERFLNFNFTAPAERVLENSLSRAQCETQCLNEASFSCRAATYDYANKLCRLFKNTRRTILSQFVDLEATMPGGGSTTQTGTTSLPDSHPGSAHVLSGGGGGEQNASELIQAAASTTALQTNSLANSSGVGAQRQSSGRQLAAGQPSLQTGEPSRLNRNIDYLENTCTPEPSSCQYRQIYDQFSPYIDRVQHAVSLGDCQRQCDQERLFSCKAINYDPISRNCMLVNEDLISLNRGQRQSLSLLPKRNTIYSEKGNCEMISVQCNSQEMLVSINFDAPFRGRVMAKGNPEQCFLLGDGQTNVQFSIVFGPKCNSRQEGHNTFVNEVVIQQHPVIMTESDKTVRVMCAFEAPEQTITLKNPMSRDGNKTGIDVGAPADSSRTRNDKQQFNSVVSNKAAPPSVLLRILDLHGRDASMINLGDDLMLRIQMQMDGLKNSALGIFARNLAARSSNGESLLLIDNDGCPVDPQVFPALEIDPKDGKSLVSTFKAFRFPSSGLVNFEVQIRFCPERCQPVDCQRSGQRVRSFGKRRRRRRQVSEIDAETQAANEEVAMRQALSLESKRAPILQSVSDEESSQFGGGRQTAAAISPLDSLSTVMKPGKAFEYVRKLMLSSTELPPTLTSSTTEAVQLEPNQAPASSQASEPTREIADTFAGANQAQNVATPSQEQPINEEFDNPAANLGGNLDASSQAADQNNYVPNPLHEGAVTQQPILSAEKTILMHVDEKVVPSTDFSSVSRGINIHPQNLAPYGRFPSATVEEPPRLPSEISAPTPPDTKPDSSGGLQNGANDYNQQQSPSNALSEQPERGSEQSALGGDVMQSTMAGVVAEEDNRESRETPLAATPTGSTSSGFHPIEPPRQSQLLQQQRRQGQHAGGATSSSNNSEMPLRFSILVGENQAPSSNGRPTPDQPSVLIMNSTSMDLDHIVIPGKKGQLELDGEQQQQQAGSLNSLSSFGGGGSAQDSLGYHHQNQQADAVEGSGDRHRHSGEAPSKRNASYEQTFDALPSNSISSEVHPVNQQQQQQILHHRPPTRGGSTAATKSAAESAASHDCQIEAGKSRLRTIIWTGGIVIALNVCLVILSLVLYFRKVHLRQNHSIVSSSSDCGTHRHSRSRGRGGFTSSGTEGGDEGGRWPSVILKSKNKLGATSLNAHEHFFCKLNGSRQTSGGGGIGGASGLEHDFNWPNLSSSSSRSTISSLASPVPSTSIRVNQFRPSLKSTPFDTHSTLRSGNFNTGSTHPKTGTSSMMDESDHRDAFSARYTNNIDILHSERF